MSPRSYPYSGGNSGTSGSPFKPIKITKGKIIGFISAIVAVFFIATLGLWFEDCNKSKIYVNQYPFTGTYEIKTDGGMLWQCWGDLHEYAKTSQVEFTQVEKDETGYVPNGRDHGAAVTFSDRGKGMIIGSLRVMLPLDSEHISKIQTDFGSEEALMDALIRPTLYKCVTACGPLMTSLQSVSETRTDLQNYIQDQMNYGIYKSRSVKVESINELTGEKEISTYSEIVADSNAPGGYKRQEVSPFSKYGITCDNVSITDIKYDAATQQQIDAQKQANLAVITSKTKSLEAIQRTVQITEEGKAAAEKAKWEQEKEKALAVTKAEQEREVSRLAAEKAEFDKKKIIAEGEAEAAANRAKVAAGLTPQERAEWDYKTAVGIAEALANSKVQWVPQVMMGGGNGTGNSAMDAVGLNMMLDVVNKMNTKK